MSQKLSFTRNAEAARTLLSWWEEVNKTPATRAKLRRCQSPVEVIFQPAFHRLRQRLQEQGFLVNTQLAHIAGLASHIKKNLDDKPFAEQLAAKRSGTDGAVLSGLRFRRLLAINDRDELFVPLMRVIRLLNGTANVLSLSDDIYHWNDWNDRVRKEWAYRYYEAAPDED